MKIIKSALVASAVFVLFGFAASFSPTKPLSMIEDTSLVDVSTSASIYYEKQYFDGYLYFVSNNYDTGNELWRSDGVTAELVKDIQPGQDGIDELDFYKKGNYLYVAINSPSTGLAFYYLTTGESELVQIETDLTYIRNKKRINDTLYFVGNNSSGSDVFSFDAGGLQQVTDNSEYSNVYISDYTFYKDGVYLIGDFNGQPGVNEYKEGNNYLIDSGKDSYRALHASEDALYFESINYTPTKREFYKYDNASTFTLAGELSQYGNDIEVYGQNLVIYSARVGENTSQIYVTSGAGFQKITDFVENESPNIEFLGVAQDAMYYSVTGRSSVTNKLFQLNGAVATEISLEFNSLKKNYPDPVASIYGGKLFFWVNIESGTVLYALEGLTLTEIYSEDSYGVSKPTKTQDHIYYVLRNTNGNKDILEVDVATNLSSIVASVDEQGLDIVSADEMLFISVNRYPDVLAIISSDTVSLVKQKGKTGSSNPYEFVELEGNTYYFTTSETGAQKLWVSDGYTTALVKSFDNNRAQQYKLFRTNNELILYATYSDKLWSVKGTKVQSIGAFESLQREPKVGDGFYFLGVAQGSSDSSLWHYYNEELKEVDSNVYPNFKVVREGLLYSKPSGEFFFYDGKKSVRLETNGLEFYGWSNVYSVTQGDYIQVEYGPSPQVYFFDKDEGLKSINIDFSQYEGFEVYKLIDEIVISLRKRVDFGYEHDFYRVSSDVAEKIDTPFMEGAFHVFGVHNNHLYLSGDSVTGAKPYYYWKGKFYEFGWRLGNIEFLTKDLELEQNWVIGYNSSESSYFVLSHSGAEVEFVTKVTPNSRWPRIDEVIRAAGGVFLKFTGNDIDEHELFYLSEEGEVSSLNDQKEFFWGAGSFRQSNLGKGHGKWLFLRGCTVTHGCEPFSMNLNQFPTAKYSSETSYYSGQKVTLDASSTEDTDGDILEYNWTQLSGPEINFESIEGENITFKAPKVDAAQDVVIELTVVDDGYDKDITSKSIRIKPNQKPSVSINAPASASEGDTVTLDASGSTDPEGGELSFVWSVEVGQNITIQKKTESVANFVVPNLSEDVSVELKLTVADEEGNESFKMFGMELKNKASGDGGSDDSDNGGSGGGGSTSWLLLMMLGLILIQRRVK